MALRGSPDVGFLMIGGRNIASDLTTFQDSGEAVVEETTGLGVANDTWAPVGVKEYMASAEGFYNTADEASLEAALLTGEQILMVALDSNTNGSAFIGSKILIGKNERRAAKRTLHRLAIEMKSELGAHDGKIQHARAAQTADGTSAAINNGASSANGAVGYLGISALNLDGGTNIIIKEEDSPDNAIWADLIVYDTITSLTDALRAQQKFATGTVDQYTRTNWDFHATAGAGKSITFATGICRQ